jgi:uncharacterized Ntn-hydrolase superfamily protein
VVISDLIPGKGAINTQAYYREENQDNARGRLLAGDSPEEIISWLLVNDITNDSALRQYGIADFDESGIPRSAAYTGVNTDDYKGHLTGPGYAIQGNILLGSFILDSMEARFLNTEGDLAERLMSALQGANVVGADTRCLDDGVSSLSSYLRVAQPEDEYGSYSLNLVIPYTPVGIDPIDTLQGLYDYWIAITGISPYNNTGNFLEVFPNPAANRVFFKMPVAQYREGFELSIYNAAGLLEKTQGFEGSILSVNLEGQKDGLYFYTLKLNEQFISSGKFVKTQAGF